MRLYTANELDRHINLTIAVDAPCGYYAEAFLLGVYRNGNFEVLLKDDRTVEFNLANVKAFADDGATQLSGCGVHSFYVD